jgi:ribonuclease P protein component
MMVNNRSVPHDDNKGIETRRKSFEKNLSTKQYLQKENPWLQAPHEYQRRPTDPEKKACQGKKTADRLIREVPSFTFPRSVRVRSRAEYLKVQRSGRKVGGRYLIILSLDNDLPVSRFGVTVSKKTGNAVTRNRVRRRIRELQRLNRDSIVVGKDIVVIATRVASEATFEKMKTEYTDLIRRAALIIGPSGK